MYQIEAWSAFWKKQQSARTGPLWLGVSRNVVALGFTSLLTDVSSEMVSTVLPIYLVLHLGLTPLHFGIVESLALGATALLRVFSGAIADRSGKCKQLAFAGYATSAVSRLGLLLAGASWPSITAMVTVDRIAKGVRTVPRDLLISLSSSPANLATGFAVHRALDGAGAMIGPLVALTLLAAWPDGFDIVFVCSFSVAVCGLAVLLLFVDNAPAPLRRDSAPERIGTFISAAKHRRLAQAAAGVTLLGLVTVSDGFIYLLLQRRASFNAGLFPLLYVGTAAAFMMLAVPAGRIADRVGREAAFVCGHVLLGGVYLMTLRDPIGVAGVMLCVALLGGYYALTDGVLMAMASSRLPEDLRGRGIGVLTTARSVAQMLCVVGLGAAWTTVGPRPATLGLLMALAAAIPVAAVLLKGDR